MWRMLGQILCILVLIPICFLLVLACLAVIGVASLALLPRFVCERERRVGWLVPLSLSYFPVLTVALLYLGFPWWLVVLFILPAFVLVPFLPNPYVFFTNPVQRKAVLRAIDTTEKQRLHPVSYRSAQILQSRAGEIVVQLRVQEYRGRPRLLYLVVGKDGAVEPLSDRERIERFGYDYRELYVD